MDTYQVKGLKVVKSYHKGQQPAISNGLFELKNHTGAEATITSAAVRVLLSDRQINVEKYHVYLLPDYTEVSLPGMQLAAGSTLSIDLSFPFVYENAGPFQPAEVELSLTIEGQQYIGFSPVEIEMRTPR